MEYLCDGWIGRYGFGATIVEEGKSWSVEFKFELGGGFVGEGGEEEFDDSCTDGVDGQLGNLSLECLLMCMILD